MDWLDNLDNIEYIGQKVNIIKGELKGKTGILKKVISFYDNVKKNALCEIECEGQIYQLREENFVFANKYVQEAWDSGGVEAKEEYEEIDEEIAKI